MQTYWTNPTQVNLSKLTTTDGISTLAKLIQFSKEFDKLTYGRLLMCLERYKKEYTNIFGYGTHEDGGYYKPPECFIDFGLFYDKIKDIPEMNTNMENEIHQMSIEYSIEPIHNNLTTDLFDWTIPNDTINKLTTLKK
jgi:hypothetical protein